MSRKSIALAAAVLFAGGAAVAQTTGAGAASAVASSTGASSGGGGTVKSVQPVHTQSMQRLQQAADRLRQSIQALAEKPPGPDRERAISEAQDALMRTQQAMMALPPELRSSGTVSTAGYDASVRKLMASADSLRQSIQEMAQQPAGQGRDRAIRQAHRALWDTQAAMVAAYQPGGDTKSMGAPSQDAGGAEGQKKQSAPAKSSGASKGDAKVSRSGSAQDGQPGAVLVLLPDMQARGTKLADGCWVRFFDEKNYSGDALTLAGPVDLPRMELGDAWRDWDSAVVGPKATVHTYDNEMYRERTSVLNAGQSIPDLRERELGWFDEVKSARVFCS